MLDLILTVLFGWAGYWKFKNGKITLGIIWLITFGAFGIGWLFDIVCAIVACSKTTKSNNQQPTVPAKALPPKPDHVQEVAPQPVTQNATMQRPAAPVPASHPIQHKVDFIQQPIAPAPVAQQPSPIVPIENIENEIVNEIKSNITVAIKKTTSCSDDYNEQVPEISCIDYAKMPGAVNKYLNYSVYKVSAYDSEGKKRLRIRTGRTPECAIKKVRNEGFLEPFEAEIADSELVTDRQLELLKRHGTSYPPDLLKDAASEMIDRIVDDRRRNGPEQWLVALAGSLGTEFSVYVGAEQLFEKMIRQASDRDRAALYAYAVRQSIRGAAFGNMLVDPDKDIFYTFADSVITDASLVKSLNGREPSDFRRPNKGTNIYKQAVAFLGGLR